MPGKSFLTYTTYFVLFIGIVLRLYDFGGWSLTNDELSALNRTSFDSLGELFAEGIRPDGHPAFTQLFLYAWTGMFGDNSWLLRFPFVIAGIFSLFLFFRINQMLFGKQAALLSTIIFSFSQLFITYSQIARPYSFGLFFILLNCWAFLQLSKTPEKRYLLAFILSGWLAIITHYFAALTFGVMMFAGVLFWNKRNFKSILLGGIAIGLLFLPHLPITLHHLQIGGISWLPMPQPDLYRQFGEHVANHSTLLLYTGFTAFAFIATGPWTSARIRNSLFCLLVFPIVYYIGYYYSLHKSPILQYSVLIFAAPFAIAFLFSWVGEKEKKYVYIPYALFLLGLSAFSFTRLDFYTKKPFANFKEVSHFISQWAEELPADSTLIFMNSNNKAYFDYYFGEKEKQPSVAIPQFETHTKIAEARDRMQKEQFNYVILGFANVPLPPEVHEFTKSYYTTILKKERFFNSEAVVYSRANLQRQKLFSLSIPEDMDNPYFNVDRSALQDSIYYKSPPAFHLKPEMPYALTLKIPLGEVFDTLHPYLTTSAWLQGPTFARLQLVVSVDKDGESLFWRGYEAAPYLNGPEWKHFLTLTEIPKDLPPEAELAVYFWNPDKSELYIDEFEIAIFKDSDYRYYEL